MKVVGMVAVVTGILVTWLGSAVAQNATVTVNWNTTHQTIDGFGVAQPGQIDPNHDYGGTGDYAGFLNAGWPEPQRSQILDLAFSQASGAGLTIFRTWVLTSLEPAIGQWSYTDIDQVALMKEAVKRGPVKLIATVPTPPAWMKTNLSLNGGTCVDQSTRVDSGILCCQTDATTACPNDPQGRGVCPTGFGCVPGYVGTTHYQDYADYLSHYASQYASQNGVSIYAVSMAGEPDTYNVGWNTCTWNTDQIANFLGGALSTTFANNNITTKVIAPEAANWNDVELVPPAPPAPYGPYLYTTERTPAAFARLDIAAGHLYDGDPTQTFSYAYLGGKKIWETEASLRGICVWSFDTYGSVPGVLQWATIIHEGLTSGRVSAWLWWNLFLWDDNQSLIADVPGAGPQDCVDPTQTGAFDGHSYSVSPMLWALGNFSKFIRPGFVVVDTSSNNSNLLASAYKDPTTGQYAIVLINNGTSALNITFNISGEPTATVRPYITSASQNLAPQPLASLLTPPYQVSVPAKSIVTYTPVDPAIVWRGTDGSVSAWYMARGAIEGTVWTGSPDTNWTIKGVGDFDGDGLSDLFWECTGPSCSGTSHGQLAIWYRLQSTNPSASYPGQITDDGWRIKGFGDFDGNGKTDVLWQYSGQNNHGLLAIWWNGQATNPMPTYPATVSDDGWQIQGIGDFDGNGRGDILWRYVGGGSGHGQLAIWWNGQYVSPQPSYPGQVSDDGWQIEGIGDFDANGRSDILWRYFGTANHGQLAVWWNGQWQNPTVWYPAVVSDDNWVIKGVADFNWDGKSDVTWQYVGPSGQTMHGQVAVWFGAQPTTPAPAYPGIVSDSQVFQAAAPSGL